MGYLDHDSLVKTANELPPLPQSVIRLTELISDINYEMRDVVRVVAQLECIRKRMPIRMEAALEAYC